MLDERPGQMDESVKDVDEAIVDLPVTEPRSSGEGVSAETHRHSSWYRDRLLLSTIPAVMLVDQVSKYLVRNNLRLYESWPEEGFFRITHGTNTGTVFGLLPDQTLFLIVASVIAIGFLYYFYRTQALPSRLLRLAVGLQLGGAFGNLLDRVRSGAVVDFIDVGPWPVFNLADSSIVVGIAVLVTLVVLAGDANAENQGADGAVDTDR